MFRISRLTALFAWALFLLTGCDLMQSDTQAEQIREWSSGTDKLKVLSTTAMIGDLVEVIGGDRISHLTLIRGEVDPHNYVPLKGDQEKFDLAQVIFANGLGLEHGAARSLEEVSRKVVSMGDSIDANQIILVSGVQDPHIWMDLSIWKEACSIIEKSLSAIDPEGRSYYKANSDKLAEEMARIDSEMVSRFQALDEKVRYLVTSHDAFNYFTRHYLAQQHEQRGEGWRARFIAPEGLSPEGQLGPQHIKAVCDFMVEHQVEVIFPESNLGRGGLTKIIQSLPKGYTARLSNLELYSDAMGGFKKSEGKCRYLYVMKQNGDRIIEEWERGYGAAN